MFMKNSPNFSVEGNMDIYWTFNMKDAEADIVAIEKQKSYFSSE